MFKKLIIKRFEICLMAESEEIDAGSDRMKVEIKAIFDEWRGKLFYNHERSRKETLEVNDERKIKKN